MKKLLFIIFTLICANHCPAQDVVERKNKLTDFVSEKYQTIIQPNKQVKQGVYHAFYDKKIVLASGSYANDKRTGIWHFFDPQGKLLENYNYDTNNLLYEAPETTSSNIRYSIDNKITITDIITKPVRPGGRYFGYVPYLKAFKLPYDLQNTNREQYDVVLELLVSPMGRLADYKIHIRYVNNETDLIMINIDPHLISEEDKVFIPATWNSQPIASTILVKCFITRFDSIDIY